MSKKLTWHLLQSYFFDVLKSVRLTLVQLGFVEPLLSWSDNLWFQINTVFRTFTPFLAIAPEVLISWVLLPYSASQWCQSDLLRPHFHHDSTAETPVVYHPPVKKPNVLIWAERIFIVLCCPASFSNEQIGSQSAKVTTDGRSISKTTLTHETVLGLWS